MGIDLDTGRSIADSLAKRRILGRALTLGRQDLTFTLRQLLEGLARKGYVGFKNNAFVLNQHQHSVLDEFKTNGRMFSKLPHDASREILSDEFFFRFIGFEELVSVDFNNYDKPTAVHDLNRPGLIDKVGKFDLIYDGGTMEHVFDTATLLKNTFEALNLNGWILHHSPTNNYVDHGFYQFSPTFFYDYYHANGFAQIEVLFTRNGGGLGMSKVYEAGGLNRFPPGSLDGAIYGTQCYAQKNSASTGDRVPQQGEYARAWANADT